MKTDETNPNDFGRKSEADYSHIKGWGIDADTKNDPTYPMKKRSGQEHQGYKWKRPPQQPVNTEVLRSVERPNITATFGTSAPPSGLSGRIRRWAFRFSESSYGRWLPLLLADRLGMVEGIVDDVKQGHLPNIFAERGWQAEWKYNRKELMQKVLMGTLITGAIAAFLLTRYKKRALQNHT